MLKRRLGSGKCEIKNVLAELIPMWKNIRYTAPISHKTDLFGNAFINMYDWK